MASLNNGFHYTSDFLHLLHECVGGLNTAGGNGSGCVGIAL